MTAKKKARLVQLLNEAIEAGEFQIWAEDQESVVLARESNWARQMGGENVWRHTSLQHAFASFDSKDGRTYGHEIVQLGFVTEHNPETLEEAE